MSLDSVRRLAGGSIDHDFSHRRARLMQAQTIAAIFAGGRQIVRRLLRTRIRAPVLAPKEGAATGFTPAVSAEPADAPQLRA